MTNHAKSETPTISPERGNAPNTRLPRNVWAASLASFCMDVSSEMVMNLVPLFLANVLGVKTALIGVIEGVAQATASLVNILSGRFSDRLQQRKWLAVAGYGMSTLAKPFFAIASSWEVLAGARWADRVGKGVRTAPRDALVADSITERERGFAFGLQRAADTAGAMVGVLIALGVVWQTQAQDLVLRAGTFRTMVLLSVIPAVLAVLSLAVGTRDVPVARQQLPPQRISTLGKPFVMFLIIAGIFDLGNSSDAFLILRAQDLGISIPEILAMLVTFNFVYALVSIPAGRLSDRIGRRQLLIAAWLLYALVYFGFAFAKTQGHVWTLYTVYGVYYGLSYGTAKALIADLVPKALRGTAYGMYSAVLGILDIPASVIAGVLWQGIGSWPGFGAPAPFLFGATLALIAAILIAVRMPYAHTQ